MLYRTFGKTGEKVSILGFGCMRFPTIGGDTLKIDENQSTDMVRRAIDEGVNYIDTAYPYHGDGSKDGGMSEPFVGKVLQDGYREKVNLATKLPTWMIETRQDMDDYLNRQLERLKTDHIDFYLIHALSKERWAKMERLGVCEFLDQAIGDGRIRYAGFSFHDKGKYFKPIVDGYDWSFCQIQYNYIDEDYQAGREGLEYARSKDLGIVVMEPLRGGNLVKHVPEDVQKAFERSNTHKSPAKWALQWVWNQPDVHVVLSGMSDMDQVIENVKIASESEANSMTPQDVAIMERAKSVFKDRIQVNCTACEYCMPCPVGVNIPENFSRLNDYFLFDNEDLKKHYQKAYIDMEDKAKSTACVKCGKCESKCPQHIPIRQVLEKVTQTLNI